MIFNEVRELVRGPMVLSLSRSYIV